MPNALGARAYVVSCVGADALGDEILGRLDALALSRDCVAVDAAHPTGTVSVELDAGGRPTYIIHENVAWDFLRPGPAMLSLAAAADAVCFGSLAQRSAVSRADDPRLPRRHRQGLSAHLRHQSAAALLRRRDRSPPVFPGRRVLKLNDEELPVVAELLSIGGSGGGDARHALPAVRPAPDRVDQGSARFAAVYARLEARLSRDWPVEVADTVGAGDAFTAALGMGMLAGLGLDVINAHANRVARVRLQPARGHASDAAGIAEILLRRAVRTAKHRRVEALLRCGTAALGCENRVAQPGAAVPHNCPRPPPLIPLASTAAPSAAAAPSPADA